MGFPGEVDGLEAVGQGTVGGALFAAELKAAGDGHGAVRLAGRDVEGGVAVVVGDGEADGARVVLRQVVDQHRVVLPVLGQAHGHAGNVPALVLLADVADVDAEGYGLAVLFAEAAAQRLDVDAAPLFVLPQSLVAGLQTGLELAAAGFLDFFGGNAEAVLAVKGAKVGQLFAAVDALGVPFGHKGGIDGVGHIAALDKELLEGRGVDLAVHHDGLAFLDARVNHSEERREVGYQRLDADAEDGGNNQEADYACA